MSMSNAGDSTPDPHDLCACIAHSIANATGHAIEFEQRWWIWDDVRSVHAQLAGLLAHRLAHAGLPVGIVIRNRPAHVAAFWSLMAQGRPAAFINAFRPIEAVAAEVAGLGLCALIADEEDWAAADLRAAAAACRMLGISLGRDSAEAVKPVAGLDQPGSAADCAALPGVAVEMLTSGTSGLPKRIPLRYDALGFAVYERQAVLSRWMGEAPPDDLPAATLIQYGPIVHLGGLFTAVQCGMQARPLALLEKFDVQAWRRAVRLYRPRMLGLPPAQMRIVLDADVPKEDLASAVSVRSGNAMLDDETRTRFEQRYGIPVLNIYGATEYCGPIASWTLEDHRRFGAARRASVGRLWPHIATARIVDAASRQALPCGEEGVLEVRIPSVGEGWITTNDLAVLDEDGFLFLKGRADEAINRGGFKIVPAVVADVLRRHPAVADVIVLGLPDRKLGMLPVAAVERRAGSPAPTGEVLRDFVRQHLAAYQVPARIVVVDALPRTPGMKISRPEAAALFD